MIKNTDNFNSVQPIKTAGIKSGKNSLAILHEAVGINGYANKKEKEIIKSVGPNVAKILREARQLREQNKIIEFNKNLTPNVSKSLEITQNYKTPTQFKQNNEAEISQPKTSEKKVQNLITQKNDINQMFFS